jgi:maltodextrin utilization protein YvdJ
MVMLNFFEILSFFYFHNLQTLLGEGSPTMVLIIDTYLYQLYASFFFFVTKQGHSPMASLLSCDENTNYMIVCQMFTF